ncbi:hypothetical protein C8K44_106202 [Aminobacter sp. AP02]|nr:hypothetical protein C8K44_106202 [Aminobacter sp. AP02]
MKRASFGWPTYACDKGTGIGALADAPTSAMKLCVTGLEPGNIWI